MGSMRGECYWCFQERSLYIPDHINEGLCGTCCDWLLNRVDNPAGLPPQPDGRTLTTAFLRRLFREHLIFTCVDWRSVASSLRGEYEPGGRGYVTGKMSPRTIERRRIEREVWAAWGCTTWQWRGRDTAGWQPCSSYTWHWGRQDNWGWQPRTSDTWHSAWGWTTWQWNEGWQPGWSDTEWHQWEGRSSDTWWWRHRDDPAVDMHHREGRDSGGCQPACKVDTAARRRSRRPSPPSSAIVTCVTSGHTWARVMVSGIAFK